MDKNSNDIIMALQSGEIYKKALNAFALDYIQELNKALRKEDKIATGDLVESLSHRIIKMPKGIDYTITIDAKKYLDYVDAGRKPGKYPPIRAISEWARVKGISQKAVFPIARKIKQEGIEPTNVIRKSLNTTLRGKDFSEFEDNLGNYYEEIVKELIFDISENNNITVK